LDELSLYLIRASVANFKQMKKLFTLLLILGMAGITAFGQTSAGKCWHIDYAQWNINTPALHILCGNDESFNVGEELTLEMWIRAYTFGENRKVMGKIASDGSSFNNGYVMGFQNLNVYTELWNPTLQQIPYQSAGPIPKDSAFVHLVTTYSAGTGKMTDYVNGEVAGETQVFPPSPIATNDAQFLIGAAPWEPNSFQFYGALDEVRVWNVARTEEQIKEFMFKELMGDEDGLVAYYNFNTAHDSIVPDAGPYQNDGVLQNPDDDCWWWADSYIPVGDDKMYDMLEPTAAWFGKSSEEFNNAVTENGFSLIASIQEKEFDKYVVFGHTDVDGTNTENAPFMAPVDFVRVAREWYVNQGGNFASDIFINLAQAAGTGEQLPEDETNNLYILMHRQIGEDNYSPIAHPDQVFNENLIFNDRVLYDGYYCVGYSSTPMTPGYEEIQFENLEIIPNPATNFINIKNAEGLKVTISDITGRELISQTIESNHQTVDITSLGKGIYFVSFEKNYHRITKKIIVK